MATKKKKAAPRKRPPVRRNRPVKTPAPLAPPAPVQVVHEGPGTLGIALTVAVLALAFGWAYHRSHATQPVPAAGPASAPESAGTPPQARGIVTPEPGAGSVPQPKALSAAAPAHRESAGAAETGSPSLTFDRSTGQPLGVRCWRAEGGSASLDIFAPKNRLVRTLKSETGKAANVELKWDGKDEQGKKVPVGLYFLRPSSKDEQSVRDVWVKG